MTDTTPNSPNRRRTWAAMAAVAAALTIAACEPVDNHPSQSHKAHKDRPSRKRLAACEAAIRHEYRRALEASDDEPESTGGGKPKECDGLSRSRLRRIVVKIIREETPTITLSPQSASS